MRLSKVVTAEVPLLSLHGAVVPDGKQNDRSNYIPLKRYCTTVRIEFNELEAALYDL